jgi:hypothetical protein
VAALALLRDPEQSGVKITLQSQSYGHSSERTTYMQGDRQRTEYRNAIGGRQGAELKYGSRLARIVRCDLGQSFELNLDASEYTSAAYPPKALTVAEMKARGLETPAKRQSETPTIRVETKTTDTGERKEIFGHIARHVITTTTRTPLPGSHAEPQESVTDGWYIDFEQRLPCDPIPRRSEHGHVFSYLSGASGNQPMEKPEFVTTGNPETGFPLDLTMTSKNASSAPEAYVSKFEMRVIDFEEGSLDPALFEIPPGFKHVDRIERDPRAPVLTNKP